MTTPGPERKFAPFTVIIQGRLTPKKNSKRVVPGVERPVGSKRWKFFEASARWDIRSQYRGALLPGDVHVRVSYYPPDRRQPDLSAVLETVGDLLEGIVYANDRQVVSWDGSRILAPDRGNPRCVVEVLEA